VCGACGRVGGGGGVVFSVVVRKWLLGVLGGGYVVAGRRSLRDLRQWGGALRPRLRISVLLPPFWPCSYRFYLDSGLLLCVH